MIVDQKISYLRMLFLVRGISLNRAYPRIAVITALSVFVTFEGYYLQMNVYSLTTAPFALIGLALGVFLGFRNNAAYDRYWEARKLWGSLVNASRNYARQVTNFVVLGGGERELTAFHREMVYKIIAYNHALRHHLRGTDPTKELEPYLTDEDQAELAGQRNVPLYLLRRLGERMRFAWQQAWIDKHHLVIPETTLCQLTDVQGACERINNTPMPFGYTVLMHRLVTFYCVALPFGIYDSVGVLTPVVVLLIAYALFGLDEIGSEIETPFGTDAQDLPLAALCRTVEVNLLQLLDETHIPEMMKPVNGVLL